MVSTLAIGLLLVLAGCSNGSSTGNAPTPSSTATAVSPVPSSAALGALCDHLRGLENSLAGMIAGTVAPSAGVQQVQDLVQGLQADAQQLQQEGRNDLGTLATDLSQAVDQIRATLASGGDVLSALGSNLTRINSDIQQIPADVCGTPTPIST